MVSCMAKDPGIAGLCGETRIGNKTRSWVTMIQGRNTHTAFDNTLNKNDINSLRYLSVFEYYISHHQTKAFESVFGGVTCLPGCFCMYRIKAPKGPKGYWFPVLA